MANENKDYILDVITEYNKLCPTEIIEWHSCPEVQFYLIINKNTEKHCFYRRENGEYLHWIEN